MKATLRVPIQVRLGDTDMHGHINNTAYLAFVEAAHQVYFSGHLPAPVPPIFPIVATTTINYRRPAHLNDTVAVDLGIGHLGTSSLELMFRVVSLENDAIVYADGTVTLVYFNLKTREKASLCAALRETVAGFDAEGKNSRHDLSPLYKGGRKGLPEELRPKNR